MSTTAVTMEELESERAELLPSRETLTTCGGFYKHHSSTSIYSYSVNQFGNGNTNQSGFGNVSFLNGDFIEVF